MLFPECSGLLALLVEPLEVLAKERDQRRGNGHNPLALGLGLGGFYMVVSCTFDPDKPEHVLSTERVTEVYRLEGSWRAALAR